jgi:hypothetical protein
MINFPSSTKIERRIPKEAFYKHLDLTASLKSKFVTDVDHIVVENSLTRESLLLAESSDIKEILLLDIVLKKQDFDGKIVEAIARQNPHKLLFRLSYGSQEQLAVYEGKLYRTAWKASGENDLTPHGDTITAIWEDLVRQIALDPEIKAAEGESLHQQLKNQDEIEKLQKRIPKLDKAAWKEEQPKKKFALYTEMKELKKQLEELTHG